MNVPERLETRRLVLTKPVAADHAEIAALFGDERVGRWMGGTMSPERAERAIATWLAHWDAHGFGMWVARDRESGTLAGRGGPQLSLNLGEAAVELGWVVVPALWGRGIGTEIGEASMRAMQDARGVREFVAKTLTDNGASMRIMTKLGLQPVGELEHVGLLHVLYRGPAPTATTRAPAAGPGA